MHEHGDRIRKRREAAGWSQAELARRAGISRAAVSAIETGRVSPSVTAALGLARALDSSVETLFGGGGRHAEAAWAWAPRSPGARFWLAEVDGRVLRVPVEATPAGVLPHDGGGEAAGDGTAEHAAGLAGDPGRTLLLAGCDPAVGLLARRLLEGSGVRLLPVVRSSRRALELLAQGRVLVAGVHLGGDGAENRAAAEGRLGDGVRLLRLGLWEEGVALSPGSGIRSARRLRRARLRWVGREEGSGARACLEELFEGHWEDGAGGEGDEVPVASDHRGVAEAVRAGWAQAGVCVRLAAEEAGLDFLPVRREAYDLCYPAAVEDDPRILALREAVRSRSFRGTLATLPGYDSATTGRVAGTEP